MDPFFNDNDRAAAQSGGQRRLDLDSSEDRVEPDLLSTAKDPQGSLFPASALDAFDDAFTDTIIIERESGGEGRTLLSLAGIATACVIAALAVNFSPHTVGNILSDLSATIVTHAGPWFMGIATFAIGLLVFITLTPVGSGRLGGTAAPNRGRFSWLIMLVAAGLGSGIVHWSIAEPLFHLQMSPLMPEGDPGVRQSAQQALAITWLHWGFHYWAVVGVMALAFSSLGEENKRRDGLVTLGVTLIMSIGLLTLAQVMVISTANIMPVADQVMASEQLLSNVIVNGEIFTELRATGVTIVTGCMVALGTLIAILGARTGVRNAAMLTVACGFAAVAFLVSDAPLIDDPGFVLGAIDEFWRHVAGAVPGTALLNDSEWASIWSGYYATWWLLLCPLPALFIAEISRGRTRRELIVAIIGVGGLSSIAWATFFGGNALVSEIRLGEIAELVRLQIDQAAPALVDAIAPAPKRELALTLIALVGVGLLVTTVANVLWVISRQTGGLRVFRCLTQGALAGVLMLLTMLLRTDSARYFMENLLLVLAPVVMLVIVLTAVRLAVLPKASTQD